MVMETFNYTKINVIEESKQRRWVDACIVATVWKLTALFSRKYMLRLGRLLAAHTS